MQTILIIKLIQSAIVGIFGILALIYCKRLTQEMTAKFKNVYGKTFNIEKLFDSKWVSWYLKSAFILLGVGALIFAFFNIVGPINNW